MWSKSIEIFNPYEAIAKPNTREKLIELIKTAKTKERCDFLFADIDDAIDMPRGDEYLADHLIANGVTIEKECHWATEQAYKNGFLKGYDKGLEDALDMHKWVPVIERLPYEDGEYLVFEKHTYGTCIRTLRFARDGRKVDKYDFHRGWKNVWFYYDSEWGHITIDSVTHWMPLPEPPKGE